MNDLYFAVAVYFFAFATIVVFIRNKTNKSPYVYPELGDTLKWCSYAGLFFYGAIFLLDVFRLHSLQDATLIFAGLATIVMLGNLVKNNSREGALWLSVFFLGWGVTCAYLLFALPIVDQNTFEISKWEGIGTTGLIAVLPQLLLSYFLFRSWQSVTQKSSARRLLIAMLTLTILCLITFIAISAVKNNPVNIEVNDTHAAFQANDSFGIDCAKTYGDEFGQWWPIKDTDKDGAQVIARINAEDCRVLDIYTKDNSSSTEVFFKSISGVRNRGGSPWIKTRWVNHHLYIMRTFEERLSSMCEGCYQPYASIWRYSSSSDPGIQLFQDYLGGVKSHLLNKFEVSSDERYVALNINAGESLVTTSSSSPVFELSDRVLIFFMDYDFPPTTYSPYQLSSPALLSFPNTTKSLPDSLYARIDGWDPNDSILRGKISRRWGGGDPPIYAGENDFSIDVQNGTISYDNTVLNVNRITGKLLHPIESYVHVIRDSAPEPELSSRGKQERQTLSHYMELAKKLSNKYLVDQLRKDGEALLIQHENDLAFKYNAYEAEAYVRKLVDNQIEDMHDKLLAKYGPCFGIPEGQCRE